MKTEIRSSILIIVLIIFHLTPAFAQLTTSRSEVGINEKLGDTIPLDLQFLNEANETVTLDQLIDKPTVLSFVYFDCPGLCSPLMDGISRVIENSDMELGKKYDAITISFNTDDTPEKAKEKKQNFVQRIGKENRDSWTYLTGKQENIQKITAATGFRYKRTGFDFAHPSAIIILSPEGKITRYLYGVDFLPFDLKMAIGEAEDGITKPTRNKVLQYCFSYDPQSQTYTLQITRIVGAIILFFAVIVLTVLFIKGRRKTLA